MDIAQRFQLEGLIQGKEEYFSETEKFEEEAFQPKDDKTTALHEPTNKILKNQNERIHRITIHSVRDSQSSGARAILARMHRALCECQHGRYWFSA